MTLTSKLPNVGTNIFSVMSGLANAHGAINIAQGFPNFGCDKVLIDLVHAYMQKGYNQYAPMPGIPELRNILATKISTLYNTDIDPDLHITITAGATQALYTAIGTVINPGDNAIVFDPTYDAYTPSIISYGGTVTPISLRAPEFKIDWNEVEERITEKTRLIIVNTPHNPLGKIFTNDDLLNLETIAERHDLFVISDEVYEHIVFDGKEHLSVLRRPKLKERSFVTYSFGKVFHATGWRVGYCVAPELLTKEFRKLHQFITFSINTPIQYALAEYLQDASKYLELPAFFQAKRDLFIKLLAESNFDLIPSEGSYFILGDYSKISDLDDMAFAKWMTIEKGVATIPLSPFYSTPPDQKIVRFCFAKTDDVLESAAEKLCAL